MPKKKLPKRPTFQVNLSQDELDKLHFIADSKGEPMTEVFRAFIAKSYRKMKKH